LPPLHGKAPLQLPLLDIDLLRTFVAIAESGSFTVAAERVHRSPGAVSMQVKRLETLLDAALFVRNPREVRLTSEGNALLAPARKMLELNEAAVAQFLSPEFEGVVRLGLHDDVGRTLLPEVLKRFARSHPRVQLDVASGRSGDMAARVDAGDLDLAVVTASAGERPGRRSRVVHRERLVWVGLEGGSAFAQHPLPLALAEEGCAWRAIAISALEASGVRFRVAYNSENTAGQEAALLADLAVSAMPASLVRAPLVVLGEREGLPRLGRYEISLVIGERPSEAAARLADRLIERFGALGR
jgi:DNA-binding transcriptional LysR family regulator